MPKVERQKFLNALESVEPGLAQNNISALASCFIFVDGQVLTYNGEIACASPIAGDLEDCAVQSALLLPLLQKIPDDEVNVLVDGSMLIVESGKTQGKKWKANRRAKCATESLEEFDYSVEEPQKWKSIGEEFTAAIRGIGWASSTDVNKFALTCIHIHPQWMEASDNYQIARYSLKTKIKEPVLARRKSIQQMIQFGMNKMSVTDSWIHFKNGSGLQFSCRTFNEKYTDLSKHLVGGGDKFVLPGSLGEIVDRAAIFSNDNVEGDEVQVHLKPGKARIVGKGLAGEYVEQVSVSYKGPKIRFQVPPKTLIEISEHHTECTISENVLHIESGPLTYVTTLGPVED